MIFDDVRPTYDASRDPRLKPYTSNPSPQTPPSAVAEITNEERNIQVAEPIADPIICDLQLDGTTRRCSAVLPGVFS